MEEPVLTETVDLEHLLNSEIPEGRTALLESHDNLERVASYCEENYLQAENRQLALEETKAFTTRSLASVAYQINTLASNILAMLDIQCTQLTKMESGINNLAMTVNIHKEKVARREIGLLTTNKNVTRTHKILAPANPEKLIKYKPQEIDFSALDNIGHGVKTVAPSQPFRHARKLSTGSSTSTESNGSKATISKATGGKKALKVADPKAPDEYQKTWISQLSQKNKNGPRTDFTKLPGLILPTQEGMAPIKQITPQTEQMPPQPSVAPQPPPQLTEDSGGSEEIASNYQQAWKLVNEGAFQPSQGARPISLGHRSSVSGGQAGSYVQTNQISALPTQRRESLQDPYAKSADVLRHDPPPQPRLSSAMLPPPPPPPLPAELFIPQNTSEPASPEILPPPPSPPPDVTGVDDDYSSDVDLPPPPMDLADWPQDFAPDTYLEKVISVWPYEGQKSDELTFQPRQLIYVLHKNDDGWWEGLTSTGGEVFTGLFPYNHVESLE